MWIVHAVRCSTVQRAAWNITNDKERLTMGKILETLIYRDGGGNRRLRDYVKVSLIIFALVIGVVIVGARNRGQMVAQVMATPRPLSTGLMPTPTEQLPAPVVPT